MRWRPTCSLIEKRSGAYYAESKSKRTSEVGLVAGEHLQAPVRDVAVLVGSHRRRVALSPPHCSTRFADSRSVAHRRAHILREDARVRRRIARFVAAL